MNSYLSISKFFCYLHTRSARLFPISPDIPPPPNLKKNKLNKSNQIPQSTFFYIFSSWILILYQHFSCVRQSLYSGYILYTHTHTKWKIELRSSLLYSNELPNPSQLSDTVNIPSPKKGQWKSIKYNKKKRTTTFDYVLVPDGRNQGETGCSQNKRDDEFFSFCYIVLLINNNLSSLSNWIQEHWRKQE